VSVTGGPSLQQKGIARPLLGFPEQRKVGAAQTRGRHSMANDAGEEECSGK
jgi:hypothetical protein